ncbi:MAG: alanine--tRNA ligase [Eubacteriales bacterium]|nr:alanine--tRNA ligase [Eubacteriales bacterium]
MKTYHSADLRAMFLKFFQDHGHAVISSASVIPENDPTVLFTTAGMHPLVPYLMGQKHPAGTRLTDVQKCVRTGDIEDVGDFSHLTFFEMLGNWSLGDYFKKEMIPWSWEFLTSEKYLGLPKDRLAFTVFAGDKDCPRDEESANLWRSCGVADDHIFYLPKENNWWGPAGVTGPCGPDTEMFIITDKEPCGSDCSPACSCGRYLEIWNDVFMQYNKKEDGTFEPLAQKNVDTGMGLERTICVLNGKKSVYETDLFENILGTIAELSGKTYGEDEATTKAFRIIADHMRTSTFIMGDDRGVSPANVDQGYVLRRLIRRAVRYGMEIGMPEGFTGEIAKVIIEQYKDVYPELKRNEAFVLDQLALEETRFAKTLKQGNREFEKLAQRVKDGRIDGESAFHLYDTYGFPVEMTCELAKDAGLTVDMEGFKECFKKHQATSQAGAEQRFKGGLADHSAQSARLHTATHLLHAALRKVLGDEVAQKGSNITAERLRFDFSFGRKMTKEEIAEVERLVNEAIDAHAPIVCEEMTVPEAKAQGAIGLFTSKYGENVKVYTMGPYSKEICGGPHATNTGDLKSFKIQKEESSSAGVRRIKAVIGTTAEDETPIL